MTAAACPAALSGHRHDHRRGRECLALQGAGDHLDQLGGQVRQVRDRFVARPPVLAPEAAQQVLS
jgi:hypothetical protein